MRLPTLALSLLVLALPLTALAQGDGPPEKVTIKVIKEGAPVPGMKLRLIGEPPGGGQITYGEGATDDAGLFAVDVPFRPGLVLFAEGTFEGVKYQSPQAAFAGKGGTGLDLTVTVFGAGATTLKDISLGANSHLSINLQEGFLDVTEVLFFVNSGRGAFAPAEGLALKLPAGHRDVTGVGGNPVFALEHIGASIPGPFLPGETQIEVRYELPFDTETLDFEQKLDVPWPQARAFIEEAPGLEISGAQVLGQELRESNGKQWRMASLQPGADVLRFTISGLPVRSHGGRWIALGLAIVVGIFGFLGGIAPVRDGEVESSARKSLLEEQAALLAELEELERDRKAGTIEPEAFDEDRAAAVDQLAAVLRALDTHQPERPRESA